MAASARTLLLLALLTTFGVAVMAMTIQSTFSLEVLGIYASFAILPVAFLEIKRRAG